MAIEDTLKALDDFDKQDLDLSVSSAVRQSPDESAKVYNLSREKGLPFDYVKRNIDKASAPDLSNAGPSVAQLMRDRKKAALSIDDIDNLSWWETAGREAGNIANLVPAAAKSISSAGYSVLGSAFNSLSDLSLAPVRSLNMATEQEIKDGDFLGAAGKYLMEIAGEERARVDSFMPKKTAMNEAVVGGIKSALVNIPAMAAGLISRSPSVAAGSMGGFTYGDSYLTAKNSGLDEMAAVSYASNQAIAEMVTERIPLNRLLGDLNANAGFVKTVANQMAREIPGEQVATIWQDAIDWAALNPDKTVGEFLAERPDAAVNTLISTVVATGLQTSAVYGIDRLGRQKELETVQEISDMANASKVRGRAVDVFEDHINNITEEYGSPDAVYIDAKEARPLFQSMSQDAAYQLLASQIDEAEAVGGDIVIPMAQFASTVATSKNFESIKGIVRLSVDSPTTAQMADQESRISSILLDAGRNVETKTRADEIYKEVTKQLINTGRMNRDVAKTSAAIIPAYVTSKATRSGLSVDEVYGMMGLKIESGASNDIGLQQNSLKEWDAILAGLDYAQDKPKQGQNDETEFLSNAPAGARYTGESALLKRIRSSSDKAFDELGGSPEAGRVGKTSLGQFSAYRTQADIIEPDSLYPDGRIEIQVFGKEQDDQGLNAEPALTFTVSKDGELSVNGPTGETFDSFKDAGWAKAAAGKDGETQSGWASLVNKDGSQMPLSQLLPLVADVHARVRAWRGDDKIGLHWSRSTGATGGIVGGRQTAVFFQDDESRGSFDPSTGIIKLGEASDLSTFLHESGHLFLEMESRIFNSPNATEQIKADGQVILDWLGLDSFDQLKNYETDPVSRDAHEKFARGFEKYLGEGKAPSVELKSVFRRFSAWMKQVYRALTNLNVELADDVRAVMDRMLATDEQIDRLSKGPEPLFKYAADAGMTEAEFKQYSREASPDSAKEALQSKMIKQLTRHYTKWWKDESVSIAKNVIKQVETQPLYSALGYIKTSDQNKLNRDAVKSYFPDGMPKKFNGLTAEGGIMPDDMAAIHGLPSGAELIDLIATEPTLNAKVKELTEIEMVRRHGDILNDGTIQEEAAQAMHNPEQAKKLVAELGALSRKTGKSTIDREAAKQYAKETIGKMAFSKIRPAQYRSAELRAAREAVSAKSKDDMAGAQKAKEQELVNFYLSREAQAAKEKAEKIRASQRAIQIRKYTSANVNTDYVNEAKVLLSAYDFRKNSDDSVELAKAKISSVRNWIESQQKDPNNVSTFVQAEVLGKLIPYSEMTLDDLQGLNDVVNSIIHAGRKISEEERVEYKQNIDAGKSSIADNRIDTYQTEIDSEIPWVRMKSLFHEATASLRKLESLARQADGLNDQGWMWRNIVKPLLDAANDKLKRNRESHEKLREIFEGFNGAFSHMKDIRKFKTESGRSIRLSYGARLSFALNLGNDGNLEALKTMTALPLTDADIANITGTLEERDWRLVQSIWDYVDSYWPEISKLEIKRSGVAPQKVLPRSFVTPSGIDMRGGYYPLAGDPSADLKQMDQDIDTMANAMMNGGASAKSTKHGSTIERVGFGGKKIDFSIGVLFNHIDGVIHDLTHWQAVKDVDRILKNEKISSELSVSLGRPGTKAMKQRLKEIAAGPQRIEGLGWVNRTLRHARLASTYSALGYSVRTAMMNMMGFTTAVADMTPQQVASGAVEYYSNIVKANEMILSKSEYMRDRGLVLNRDIAQIKAKMRADTALTKFQDGAFWMMTQTDKAITRPIWLAAYREGEMKFDTEKEAIDHADRMVARTQGSGMDLDLATVETKNEAYKTLTVMYTAFSAIYNIAVEQTKRYKAGKISATGLALRLSWLTVVPGILTSLLTGSDDDEPEDMLMEIAGQGLGMIPIARDAFSYARYGASFPAPILRLATAPVKLASQVAQGEIDKGLIGAASEVASWAHIPGGAQLTRTYGYISDMQDGEIEEFSPIDLLITGKE